MNQPHKPSQRHTWRPADRRDRPARLQVRRRNIDGVRGEPFLVHPMPLRKPEENPVTEKIDRNKVHASLGATARRHSLLEQAIMQADQTKRQKRTMKYKLRPTKARLLSACAMLVLAATGYVTVDTWLTNRTVLAQAQQREVAIESKDTTTGAAAAVQTGRSTASETKRYTLADYKVAADMPRAVYIKKINMSGRILPMGLKNGAVDAPKNAYDAGWYTGSAKPGAKGAALFDGHTSDVGNFGLFGKLDKLTDGDIITIEMGDGTRLDYKVIAKEKVSKDAVDMSKALKVQGGGDEGATFITCAGTWIESEKTMTERLIVYTQRV